jgi:hypothetical protein
MMTFKAARLCVSRVEEVGPLWVGWSLYLCGCRCESWRDASEPNRPAVAESTGSGSRGGSAGQDSRKELTSPKQVEKNTVEARSKRGAWKGAKCSFSPDG